MTSVFSKYSGMRRLPSVFEKYALQRPIKRMVDERVAQGKPLWSETDDMADSLSQYGATRGDVERYAKGRAASKNIAQAQHIDANRAFIPAASLTPIPSSPTNRNVAAQFTHLPEHMPRAGSATARALAETVPLQNYQRAAADVAGPDLAQRLKAFKTHRVQKAVEEAGPGLLSRAGNWALQNPLKAVGAAGAAAIGGNALFGGNKPAPQPQPTMYNYGTYDDSFKTANLRGYAKSVGAGAAAGGLGGYMYADPGNKGKGVLGGAALGGAAGGGAKFLSNVQARGNAMGALGDLEKNFHGEQRGYFDLMDKKINAREAVRSAMGQAPAAGIEDAVLKAQQAQEFARANHDIKGLHSMMNMSETGFRQSQDEINQKLQGRLGRIF